MSPRAKRLRRGATYPRSRAERLRRGATYPRFWPWVRLFGGIAILAVLVWRLGTGGFVAGLRLVDAGTLFAAFGIGLLTTVLSAWRWCLVARGLGVSMSLPTATADYYRAMFLNVALPGGILGDVHRAVRHGRDVGNLGLGVRAVALERFAGQVVVVTLGVGLLVALPAPVFWDRVPSRWWLAVGGLAIALAVGLAVFFTARAGLLARKVWPGIVFSSTMVLAGYLAIFLVAARAAGATASTVQLLPLLVLALLAMAIPMNVGGWGPREGVSAWAFGAAGLGASQGLTVAVIYGLAVFVASLPGAGVLAVRWFACRRSAARAADPGHAGAGVQVEVTQRSARPLVYRLRTRHGSARAGSQVEEMAG